MKLNSLLTLLAGLLLAGSSQAATKLYSASKTNGTASDQRRILIDACPPIVTSIGVLEGFREIEDDALGTVTLTGFESVSSNLTNIGPEALINIFGPGAFIFVDNTATTSISAPAVSNTSGIGVHGPSGTAPGESAEWGIISGFTLTGRAFCLSSPTTVCDQNGFSHAATLPAILPSTTYDLGTWTFDAATGDLEAATWYINRTSNGGLTNIQVRIKGAFHGESLPALPLIGFGALAFALAAAGARSLRGDKS